jgi:S1-C subfamily serine protease
MPLHLLVSIAQRRPEEGLDMDWSTPPRWIAAAALIAVVSGCGGPSSDRTATAAAQRLDLSVVAVTARIGGDREHSAGVMVDVDRGLIVTTAHSVWGARSLKIATGIAVLHGRVIARDACDDLAVLETQPRLPGLVAVRPSADDDLLTGRPIVAVRRHTGLPSSRRPDLVTQRVAPASGPPVALMPGVRPKGAAALEGPGLPATATGAPLLGADGRLAGLAQVVERQGRTTRTALPWETIDARLRELRPGGRAAYVGWRRHYRCSDALHRYAAERHPKYRRGDAQLNAPVPATRLPGTEGVDR